MKTNFELLLEVLINLNIDYEHYRNESVIVKIERQDQVCDIYDLCRVLSVLIHPANNYEYIIN